MTNVSLPRILITDDQPGNRNHLQNALMHFLPSAIIETAENGFIAIDKIKELAKQKIFYQLIFMDFCMPFINGLDTVKKIREFENTIHHHTIIITWSSSKTKPLPETDDWLAKPFEMQDVQSVLKTYHFI